MDQKKTLWIIVAVGAFLLAVLGAACILYKPVNRPVPAVANVNTDMYGNGMPAPAPESGFVPKENAAAKVNDLFVVADNATVYGTSVKEADGSTTIDLNSLKRDMSLESPAAPQNINITVNVPETKTSDVVKVETEPVRIAPPPAPVPVPEEKPAVKPESKSSASVKQPEPAKKAVTVSAPGEKKAAPAPKTITQFWVQVAAFGSKKAAEAARSVLDENKITSDIFTYKDNKDKLFYRVRVGPYTTKSEAEYWRVRISKIDEFAKTESYVTSTTSEAN